MVSPEWFAETRKMPTVGSLDLNNSVMMLDPTILSNSFGIMIENISLTSGVKGQRNPWRYNSLSSRAYNLFS